MEKLLTTLCQQAAAAGRETLLEHELYALLEAGGLTVPRHFILTGAPEIWPGQLVELPGERVVLKVVSPAIAHKTELGGVRIARNQPADILAGAQGIVATVSKRGGKELASAIAGILVVEYVDGELSLGGELLAGLRRTPDMGYVVTLGLGGLDAEELSRAFAAGEATVTYSAELLDPVAGLEKFKRSYAYRRIAGLSRSGKKLVGDGELLQILTCFQRIVRHAITLAGTGWSIEELEVNPFLVRDGACVAADALCRLAPAHDVPTLVDLSKVRRLLTPDTVAIVGVSANSMNVGRVILGNLLREGFPIPELRVIRPGSDDIDGVACVDSIADLPWVADLLVITVGARQVGPIMAEVMVTGKAAAVIIIAGGMGETAEGRTAEDELRQMVSAARGRGDPAPVIVGPNCLGIRSRPGKYDTLFIPERKLARPQGTVSNSALICQSGAFMVTRMDGLGFIDLNYVISTGNQVDLSLTDFAEVVLADDTVDVLALYIEGFQILGGLRLAGIVKQAVARGKKVFVYKAGQTRDGQSASASHTASISSDYLACTEVLRDAGASMATTFEELQALLGMAALLHKRQCNGGGIAALSNAGFEAVGMADNLVADSFHLPELAPATKRRIATILAKHQLSALVTIRNPLDITPMAPDRVYADCLDALLGDPAVGAAVVGIVPHTPALLSLPPGADASGGDSLDNPLSLHHLLPPIITRHNKPVVAAVDAGHRYDALATALQSKGVPCLRTADFAMRMLQVYLGG